MIVVIDNYDSFTYNLVHYLGELGAECIVFRNDLTTPAEVLARTLNGIVLSPGPADPNRAGICLDLVRAAAGIVPLLGVCLGHQTLGQAFGCQIVRAPVPMHGKLSRILHHGTGVFEGLAENFLATRYHSLMVERETLPKEIQVTAETEDGIIMGLQHRQLPIHGVQFHPESIASQLGHPLLENFLRIAGVAITPETPRGPQPA